MKVTPTGGEPIDYPGATFSLEAVSGRASLVITRADGTKVVYVAGSWAKAELPDGEAVAPKG